MAEAKRKVKVVVISDVHLGFIGCKAKELNKYLKSIEPEILVINGDLIDIWQFRSYYFPKSHTRVLQRIFKFVSDGVKVYYLTGNHDELLRRYSGLILGNLELEDKLVLDLDGKQNWFFHGDIFDVTMRGSRWLAKLGTTGYELLILINKLVNFFLELFGKEKSVFSQQVKAATKRGIKKFSDYEMSTDKGKVTYLNSGDWVENMTALEYNDGAWKLVWFKDLKFAEDWLTVEPEDLP